MRLCRVAAVLVLLCSACDTPTGPTEANPFSGDVLAIKRAGDRVWARRLVLHYRNDSNHAAPVECAFDPLLDDGTTAPRRWVTSPTIPARKSVRFRTITELTAEPERIVELEAVSCAAEQSQGGTVGEVEILP